MMVHNNNSSPTNEPLPTPPDKTETPKDKMTTKEP